MAENRWVAMIHAAKTRDRLREIWATMRQSRAEPYLYVDLFIARYEAMR